MIRTSMASMKPYFARMAQLTAFRSAASWLGVARIFRVTPLRVISTSGRARMRSSHLASGEPARK
jgi:hypothetical protein